jgi:CheY-like chemotaxis protein
MWESAPFSVGLDGYEAVRILAGRWVDLLIADIKMPGLDGFELARQAKLMRPNLYVIYLSATSSHAPSPRNHR